MPEEISFVQVLASQNGYLAVITSGLVTGVDSEVIGIGRMPVTCLCLVLFLLPVQVLNIMAKKL